MIALRIFIESFRIAAAELTNNKLRTFLSLLGITIGIFCIIAVLSAVDSLERSIRDGFSELGSDVVYVDKQPWTEDPQQNYWKYLRRPDAGVRDYEAITQKSKLAEGAAYAFFTGGGTIKHGSSSVEGVFYMGTTYEYQELQKVEIAEGRYFTETEYRNASNVVLLGHKVKDELFGLQNAIGKEVKLFGQKFRVIGVLKEEGEDPFNFINFDDVVWSGINNTRKFYSFDDFTKGFNYQKLLLVKAKEGVELDELKDELTGIIRGVRRLKPYEEENFALNELSMFEQILSGFFGALNIAGFTIGIFALIVGMISVANIMFVSVKERTVIVGVKKALGAKKYFILMEFLLEAIFLCIMGGLMGLAMVWGVMKLISMFIPFELWLSMRNVIIGVGVSVIVGIISGVVPAWQASNMDPVEAMRK
jgi:putative ABC transport system permease protein